MRRSGGWIAVVLLIAVPLGLWAATPVVSLSPPVPATGGITFLSDPVDSENGRSVYDASADLTLDMSHRPAKVVPASATSTVQHDGETFSFIGGGGTIPGAPTVGRVKLSLRRIDGFGRWGRLVGRDVMSMWATTETDNFRFGIAPSELGTSNVEPGRYRAQLLIEVGGGGPSDRFASEVFYFDVAPQE